MKLGKLLSIHTAPSGETAMTAHKAIEAVTGMGLDGDRYATIRAGDLRHTCQLAPAANGGIAGCDRSILTSR